MTELSSGALRLCSSSATARGDLWGRDGREHDLSLITLHPAIPDRRYTYAPSAVDRPFRLAARRSLLALRLLLRYSWEPRHTSPMPRPPTSSPPPAGFSFAAGHFDYPHASGSPPSTARSSSRNVLRLADEPPARSSAHLDRLIEARRRVNRRRLHRLLGPPRDSDSNTAYDPLGRPPTANPNRPRATPSERYLQRAQARIDEERAAAMNAPTEPFDALSERPPIIADFEEWLNMANRQPSASGLDSAQRRAKRRKLDHESGKNAEYQSFKYGYKGQMVPGRLLMEVLSCDGGQIKRDNPMKIYDVENVLKNDKSVYCSESSKCNLLLRHTGDAPFALEKVVIRAPDRGFTSPYVCPLVV